jgi:hypothetical protein
MRVLTKTTYLGLFINVMAPVGLLLLTAFLKGENIQSNGSININVAPVVSILFFVMLFITAIDYFVAYYIRKKMPVGCLKTGNKPLAEQFEKSAFNIAVILYVLNASITVYGLVLAGLGAGMEAMMLFVALTLIGYQLFRPRQSFLERLWDRVEEIHKQQKA